MIVTAVFDHLELGGFEKLEWPASYSSYSVGTDLLKNLAWVSIEFESRLQGLEFIQNPTQGFEKGILIKGEL